jgi:hypothetical protein
MLSSHRCIETKECSFAHCPCYMHNLTEQTVMTDRCADSQYYVAVKYFTRSYGINQSIMKQ